jgi:hypothetical protein
MVASETLHAYWSRGERAASVLLALGSFPVIEEIGAAQPPTGRLRPRHPTRAAPVAFARDHRAQVSSAATGRILRPM